MEKEFELHVVSTSGIRKHKVSKEEYKAFVGQLQACREHAVIDGKLSYKSEAVLHTSLKELE